MRDDEKLIMFTDEVANVLKEAALEIHGPMASLSEYTQTLKDAVYLLKGIMITKRYGVIRRPHEYDDDEAKSHY